MDNFLDPHKYLEIPKSFLYLSNNVPVNYEKQIQSHGQSCICLNNKLTIVEPKKMRIKAYEIDVVIMDDKVPLGIAVLGSFKSPLMPDPAKIPVT